MKNDNAKWLWLLAIPVLLVVIILVNSKEEKAIDWHENYANTSKDPFGTFAVFELLRDYNKNQQLEPINKPVHKSITTEGNLSSYVFIGDQLFLGQKDLDSLLTFVDKGNTAFISGNNFPENLMDTLFHNVCNSWNGHYTKTDSIVKFNFEHEDLKDSIGFVFKTPVIRGESRDYAWRGINGIYFCDSLITTESLGNITSGNENFVNFIRFEYGKGSFIFHTSPIIFTNYYLLRPEGRAYADRAFSHLGTGKIFWDEFSNIPYSENSGATSSPIKLILQNQSLKTAWYFSLILIALYIIFSARRKQKAIPLIEQNINTSLDFIKTVGSLYFQQNQHRKLMRLKQRYFLSFIRQRYHIATNKTNDDLFRKLSQKSGISITEVEKTFAEFRKIDRYDQQITIDDLIALHTTLDYFYKNCK
jgi:hypothetical protein